MSENPTPTFSPPDAPLRARKGWRWVGVSLLVFLGLFTALVAWQARDIEARILAEIQPHLVTDVHIERLDVSFWRAWPNVEVALRGVRIADALDPQADFLVMDRVDLSVAWLSLLDDQLEVESLSLVGGEIRVDRKSDGRGNWVFWKTASEGESSLEAWQVEQLRLSGVTTAGVWRGEDDPVVWSVRVSEAALGLGQEASGDVVFQGEVDLAETTLKAAGQTWLDQAGLQCGLRAKASGNEVVCRLSDARLSCGEAEVSMSGAVRVWEGRFGMVLGSGDAEWRAVESVMPPELRTDLKAVTERLAGRGSMDVVVGREALPESGTHWRGPEGRSWPGAWAVRLGLSGTTVAHQGQVIAARSGQLVACDQGRSWKAEAMGVRAGVAGGEVSLKGQVFGTPNGWQAGVLGEGIFRPEGLLPWMAEWAVLPSGWTVSEGGQIQFSGGVEVTAVGGELQAMEWAQDTRITAEEVGITDGHFEARVASGVAEWKGAGWQASISGIQAPGVASAEVQLDMRDPKEGRADVVLAAVDVAPLLDGLNAWSAKTQSSAKSAGSDGGPWAISVDCGGLAYGALRTDRTQMTARWQGEVLTIESLEADAMGGRLQAEGRVTGARADLEGRMSAVDVAAFLEGTEGLGQSTLLPRHVRGQAWAEGRVGYALDRKEGVPWDADVLVRVEDGELIDFDLLQEIPATLEADRKYRFVADAEDMRRRLKRVRFSPLTVGVELERDVITVASVTVESDAMDVGVEGWYRFGGELDFTLDFALRDLKSGEGELGAMEEDGLGHRFFLAVGGTLEDPEFGYDRAAHQTHRREQRQGAWSRLKGVLNGEPADAERPSGEATPQAQVTLAVPDSAGPVDSVRVEAPVQKVPQLEDDDDDF